MMSERIVYRIKWVDPGRAQRLLLGEVGKNL